MHFQSRLWSFLLFCISSLPSQPSMIRPHILARNHWLLYLVVCDITYLVTVIFTVLRLQSSTTTSNHHFLQSILERINKSVAFHLKSFRENIQTFTENEYTSATYQLEILQFGTHQLIHLEANFAVNFDTFFLLDQFAVVFLVKVRVLVSRCPDG